MLYLARLRMNREGRSRIFTDPKMLQKALKEWSKDRAHTEVTSDYEGATGGSLEEQD